jgi:hypothetical protein
MSSSDDARNAAIWMLETKTMEPEAQSSVVLDRIIGSLEDAVPGLRLEGVVGDARLASELFPDYTGDASTPVDPALRLRELGVIVSYNGGAGWGCRGSVSSDPTIERWAHVARQLLWEIQDILVTETTQAWPPVPGPEAGELPSPGAAVERGVLHMWFGDRAQPVLRFMPVRLLR